MAFLRLLAKWRKEGSLDGLELTYGADAKTDGAPVPA
jgi:cyclohexanone monooxygenase